MRNDLLALTQDDLAGLSNRGTVKRALRELEAGSPSCQIDETADGEILFAWSDGVTCRFRADDTVHSAVCSSGVIGVSRHVIRSVLAYQERYRTATDRAVIDAQDTSADAAIPTAPAVGAWDPGAFTDDELAAHFRRPAIAKARTRFQQGVLVELARGEKPFARFLDQPCTVRFLVPGDLRYATADCAEPLLSTFVPLAVWAFRELPAERRAGLVSVAQADLPAPIDVLDELRALLSELFADGVAGCQAPWSRKLSRVVSRLRETGLIWPAELAADLARQHEMYHAHDARFDPLELVQTVGELLARSRAIAHDTKEVPQPLIRGTAADRVTEIAGGRLIGLGLGVRLGRRVATLAAYLHEVESGNVVAVERTFADPPPEDTRQPKAFCDLAGTVLARGISIGALSGLQVLLKGGKRTPRGQLILPRGAAALGANPQAFAWEQLKSPTLIENFAQLTARLDALPPSYLRPRRLTEDLHVCPVRTIEQVAFDVAQQRLTAVLVDGQGNRATLTHPYHSRGRLGFECLAEALKNRSQEIRFVCGVVSRSPGGLVIRPVALVFDDGQRRQLVQPWTDSRPGETAPQHAEPSAASEGGSPLTSFYRHLCDTLADLAVSGTRRCDRRALLDWRELAEAGQGLGFVKFVEPIRLVAERLGQKIETVHWDPAPGAAAALELSLLARVAAEHV